MRTGRPFFAALAAVALFAAPPLAGEEPDRHGGAGRAALWIEAVDPAGTPLADLEAADLEVLVAGRPAAVHSLEPPDGEWRIVLYFDQRLSDLLVFRTGAHDLSALASRLTAHGTVEVVLADEQARTAFPATRDPEVLAQALSWILVRESSFPNQVALRQSFVDRVGPVDPSLWVRADAGRRISELAAAVRDAVADEQSLLQEQRRLLVEWLTEQDDDGGPRLLLLVGEGWDARPEAYYRQLLEGGPAADALSGLDAPEASPTHDELERALAVSGWTVAAYAPPGESDPLLVETAEEAREREEDKKVETSIVGGRLQDKTTVGIDPRKLLAGGDEAAQPPRARLLAPAEPLARLAESAGGALVRDRQALADLVDRLPARRRLVVEAPQPQPLEAAPVEVTLARRRGAVRSPTWLGGGTPRAFAALRGERVLRSEEGPGELEVTAALAGERDAAEARLAVRIEGVRATPETPLRLTVAVDRAAGGAEIVHYLVDGVSGLSAAAEPDGALRVDLPVDLWRDPEAPVAVVAEELASGRWGAAVAEETGLPEDDLAESLILPAPKAIHLMAPRSAMVMGRTTFDAVVSRSQVARVDFFLDGRRVATSYDPPHSAVIDLGKLPETHIVEAVAYGVGGEELDRDRLTVNEGTGTFRVRLIDPRGEAERRGEPLTGAVEIEAEIRLPRGSELERLDFYWNDEPVGTRFAPPYRQLYQVPAAAPRGFVRVVGRLVDGTTAEDVLLLNSPGESERLDVDLVQLFVVVTDRRGRPVQGLDRDRFRLLEEGRPQTLATFGDAGELPLTVGLAIDSSASMFVKLPEVQAAASDYLEGLEERKDRAFVVGFGGEPQLARDTTSDLRQVRAGLYRLEPDGRTAIWKAVVYSLVQLQGVPGKKALIVYSDGADEDPDFSFRTALAFSRRVGVPVYFIVSNDEIYRTGGRGLNVRGFIGRLEKLSAEVGGRVYLTRVDDDLHEIYREIDAELRSQYLLGFYAESTGDGKWREVDVEVDVPGATARTIAGYYR